jgi:hypothetical protein
MATKAVAWAGDVQATAGTTMFTGADSGTWTAGPVQETVSEKLTTGNAAGSAKKVVTGATCTFTFSGKSGNLPASGTSTVQLTAGKPALTVAKDAPLVDGDSKSDTFGNELKVTAKGPLHTE